MGICARRYNPEARCLFLGAPLQKGAQPNHEHASADNARAGRTPTAPALTEAERNPARSPRAQRTMMGVQLLNCRLVSMRKLDSVVCRSA